MTATVVQLRDAIAETIGKDLTGVHVTSHGGRFEVGELLRVAARTPALVVTCLGADAVEWVGPAPVIVWRFAAFVVTQDVPGLARTESGLALTQVTLARIHGQRFNADNALPPEDLRADSLYSGEVDRKGVSMWAITWTQKLRVDPDPPASLVAFESIAASWRNEHGTEVADDLVELEQA